MARLYWIVTSLVLALVVHVSYVLVAPAWSLQRSITSMVSEPGKNRFFIIGPGDQARLFPSYPPAHIFGACAFDVSASKVDLAANLPDGMWTLTIYSASGDVIYTLNDTQSGSGRFTLSLALAPSLFEMLSKTGSDEPINVTGWDVKTPESSGLAVFWVPVREAAMRAGVIRVLTGTVCRQVAASL